MKLGIGGTIMSLQEKLERLKIRNEEQGKLANSDISNSCTGGGCHTGP